MAFLELKVPPPLIAALMVVGMLLTRSLFPYFGLPQAMVKLFAIVVIFVAVVFGGMAISAFRKHQTTVNPHKPQQTNMLVTTGVFGVTRNPMYVALILVVGAIGLYLQHTGFVLFTLLLAVYLQFFQIKPEERLLLEKFSDDYSAYMRKVPRWF
ncbi:MAG: isoprenylcysteine carboxylmethyltransferase family protein [Pseudomonadota bacterium]